jgi:hypothetical protein
MDSDVFFLKYFMLFYFTLGFDDLSIIDWIIFKFSCALKSLLNAYKEKLKAKKETTSLQCKKYIYYDKPLKHLKIPFLCLYI